MSSNTSNTSKEPPDDPYNVEGFEEFLKAIGESNIENWSILAEALGVDRTTIIRWKKHPLARQAIKAGIAKAIEGMEKSGKDDWKMHREKAKMLGVKDRQTLEHEVGEGVTELLDSLQTDYGKFAENAGQSPDGQVVANEPLVQNQE